MSQEFFIGYFICGVVVGLFTATVAEAKRYPTLTWFCAGVLFNVIALLAIVGMPMAEAKSKVAGGAHHQDHDDLGPRPPRSISMEAS